MWALGKTCAAAGGDGQPAWAYAAATACSDVLSDSGGSCASDISMGALADPSHRAPGRPLSAACDVLSDSGASDVYMAPLAEPSRNTPGETSSPPCEVRSESEASCSDTFMGLPGSEPTQPHVGDPPSRPLQAPPAQEEEVRAPFSEVDAVLAQYSVTPLAGPGAVPEFALSRIRELACPFQFNCVFVYHRRSACHC